MERKDIKIKTADKFSLDGVFIQVEDSSKGIIFAHGMTVNKDDEGIFVRAEPELNRLGFSTIRFDFRAHGKSSGDSIRDFTISGEVRDLGAVVDFMRAKGIDWLGLAGASFGGSIAALYAGRNPDAVQMLFLANPVLDYDKAFLHPTTVWAMRTFINLTDRLKRFGFIEVASRRFKMGKPLIDEMRSYYPYQELENYMGPLLAVHGSRDEKVDIRHVQHRFDELSNASKEFRVIKGSKHGFHDEPYESEVVDMIARFFSQT
ncbi:alpha/beta fold hydrolase [Candidatus Curtissbacteria bacterium]|nr:alpha/beta fold hydrolase [Candidatus Curtissbacteria bacterium]